MDDVGREALLNAGRMDGKSMMVVRRQGERDQACTPRSANVVPPLARPPRGAAAAALASEWPEAAADHLLFLTITTTTNRNLTVLQLCPFTHTHHHEAPYAFLQMPPSSQTVLDPNGYLYQLPSLGLPDPAGEWVRVLGAIGFKDDSLPLVESTKVEDVPILQRVQGEHGLIEVEYQDAIWFMPTAVALQSASRPKLFSVNVQRLPAAGAPPSPRSKLPKEIDWIFINKQAQALEMGRFERSELQLESLYEMLEGQFSIEVVRHFRRCINPSAAEAEPVLPPLESRPPRAADEDDQADEDDRLTGDTTMLWLSLGRMFIKEDRRNQLHHDVVTAGLYRSLQAIGPDDNLARFRVSHEPDLDIRGIDYALSDKYGNPPPRLAEWLPVPPRAVEAAWIRLGVNLFRFSIGKRLFTKEEWPPRPTSLMVEKGMTY